MNKLQLTKELRNWRILTLLVCASLLVGHVIFFVHPSLLLLRFALVIGLAYLLFTQQKSYSPVFYWVMLYFVLYTAWTLFISHLYATPLNANLIINFLHIPLIIFVTLGLMLQHPRESLKCLYIISLVYLLIQVGFGIVEHFSGYHLSTSTLVGAEGDGRFLPSGLCIDQNDYAIMMVLPLCFVISYRKIFQAEKSQWVSLMWFALVSLCVFWSACRTAMLCEVLFVLFYFRKYIRKYWKTALAFCFLALVAGVIFYFRFDHSFTTRLKLYGQAFASLYSSYGLGFGITGDLYFFQQLNNYDITSGYTNAHSYLFQILFTSGLPIFIVYIVLISYLLRTIARKHGRNEFWGLPFLYIMALFAPSSALFLWGQYLFFCAFVCYAALPKDERREA